MKPRLEFQVRVHVAIVPCVRTCAREASWVLRFESEICVPAFLLLLLCRPITPDVQLVPIQNIGDGVAQVFHLLHPEIFSFF